MSGRMGKRFLIDSNVLIQFQSNSLPVNGQKLVANILDKEFLISVISEIEVLGYSNVDRDTELFIELATVININRNIVEKTIAIRKAHKIKLPDAIIAATALFYGLTLITRNVSDFKSIANLKMVNPWEI